MLLHQSKQTGYVFPALKSTSDFFLQSTVLCRHFLTILTSSQHYDSLIILGVTEICSLRLFLEQKAGKEIPTFLRFEFLEKFSGNNSLSDAEGNTSGSLSRGGIANLPFFRTLLALRQKS